MSQVIQKQIGVFQNFGQYVQWVREVKGFSNEEVDEAVLLYGWSQAALKDDDRALILAVKELEYLRDLEQRVGVFENVEQIEAFLKKEGINHEFDAETTLLLNLIGSMDDGVAKVTDSVLRAVILYKRNKSVVDGTYMDTVEKERKEITAYFQSAGINGGLIH